MRSLRHNAATTLAVLLAACASGGRRAPLGPVPADECMVGTGPGDRQGRAGETRDAGDSTATIAVALTTALDSAHAPWPRDPAERLLFAQLYEPLVLLDCTGAVVPGVARTWNRDSTSAAGIVQWSFVLRGDARFANGESARAADVISSWRASAQAHANEPTGSLIAAIASGSRTVDDSTLRVTLPDSLVDLRAFASSLLAVAQPSAARSAWPDGTTSYDLDSARVPHTSGASGRRPAMARIALRSRDAASPLLFQVEAGADPRDILDAGADVLITSSPAAVEYARTQVSRTSVPLPWTRTYVLVLPAREADGTTADCAGTGLRPLRDALALAVHVEARGAEGPCWWEANANGAVARARSGAGSREILYPVQDATARELAERIVALAAPGREESAAAALHRAAPGLFGAGVWNAAGVDSTRFAERLALASDGAYILALPREPAWSAAARASLLAAAPWLAPLGRVHALLPLVDTRETLLIRRERGIPRMTILHDGTVIFEAPANAGSTSAP